MLISHKYTSEIGFIILSQNETDQSCARSKLSKAKPNRAESKLLDRKEPLLLEKRATHLWVPTLLFGNSTKKFDLSKNSQKAELLWDFLWQTFQSGNEFINHQTLFQISFCLKIKAQKVEGKFPVENNYEGLFSVLQEFWTFCRTLLWCHTKLFSISSCKIFHVERTEHEKRQENTKEKKKTQKQVAIRYKIALFLQIASDCVN